MSSRRPRGALKAEIEARLSRADGPLTARTLHESFGADAPPMTSIFTVLERLRRAGVVERVTGPDGELEFTLVLTESPQTAQAMLEELLRTDDRSGALSRFAGSLDADDAAALRRALADGER
jgi:Fe2+ or Zn2+ uptake regulation protein